MLKNYLRMYFRNLKRNKIHNAINIFSLAFALTVSIAIVSWVKFETSFDEFHEDSDRIYRLIYKNETSGRVILPAGYKNFVFNKLPEIEHSVRILDPGILGVPTKIESENEMFTNDKMLYSDAGFFNVFSFQLLSGDKQNVLDKPNSVVITEKTAKKHFGDKNPVGETLIVNDNEELKITAVIKNIPDNSHFQFDLLASMHSSRFGNKINAMGFGNSWVFYNYVKVAENIVIPQMEEKFIQQANAIKEQYPYVEYKNLIFQPLNDIHLHSNFQFELGKNNDIKYVYLFSIIGIMILIIAGINYINLSLAYSGEQTKNIGIQKVFGAGKKQIIQHFIFNSIMVSIISIIVAWILLELLTPVLAIFSDNLIHNDLLLDGPLFVFILLSTLFLGITTGFFPAIILSKFKPAQIFRSDFLLSGKKKSGFFRKTLVTFQFIISTTLIIGTIIVYQQMQYVQVKDLGYNKDHTLVLPINYNEVKDKLSVLKNNLISHSSILGATAVSQLPCDIKNAEGVNYEDNRYASYYLSVDKDFFTTMDVKLLKGSEQIKSMDLTSITDWDNFQNKFVINEQLLQEMGLSVDDAINKEVVIRHGNMVPGPIIGIMKDFHFESLHNTIKPLIVEFDSRSYQFLLVNINSKNIPKTIDYIKNQWQTVAGNIPFAYNFLDKQYGLFYKTERQMGKILLMFSTIAILIAALGLLGLSLFSINKKTKEIGLRKVLGGSVRSIIFLLTKELTKWVLIANIFAWPIAWFIMNNWLQNYPFRITIGAWPFILSALFGLSIAVFTVCIQTTKAATANPVDCLRYE